jgi:Spy/CpxP family protein refolding chaperone
MNNMKILFFSITLLMLLSLGSFAQYDNDEDFSKDVKIQKHKLEKKSIFPDELKLTDQQKNDIKKISLNTKKTIMPLRNLLIEKKAHLRTLSVAEKANIEEINQTIDEISAINAQIMKKREATKQEIRKLLTEEQRLNFDSKPPVNQKMRRKIIREFHEE